MRLPAQDLCGVFIVCKLHTLFCQKPNLMVSDGMCLPDLDTLR